MSDVVKTIYSEDPDLRAEILARGDGSFEVEICRQFPREHIEEAGVVVEPYWAPVHRSKTIVATLELAEAEARARLASHSY